MTKLLTSAHRDGIVPSPNIKPQCRTCIGCGLLAAIDLLSDYGPTAGAILIILTDGNESGSPRISDVLDDIVDAGVRVFPIAYGNLADKHLETLAQVSNGKTFYIPKFIEGQKNPTALEIAIAMSSVIESRERSITKVMDKSYSNLPGSDLFGSFVLDASNNSSVSFAAMFDLPNSMQQVTVQAPNQSSPPRNLKAFLVNNVLFFRIRKPQAGRWQYRLRMKTLRQNIGVSVASQRAYDPKEDGVEPIETDGWINVNTKQIKAKKTPVAFFAQVQQKGKPVLHVNVLASVLLPNGQVIKLHLYDNGVEPDMHADDGLYSRYFVEFAGPGRYGVKYDISNHPQEAYNDNKHGRHSQAFVLQSRSLKMQQDVLSPMRSFQRSIVVGSFTVLDDVNSGRRDVIPPNTIRDLKIVHLTQDLSHVTLEWTAPGDDYDRGNATSYEIKYSEDPKLLTSDVFGYNPNSFTQSDVVNKKLTPLPALTKQKVTLRLSEIAGELVPDFYLAIRAVDEVGNGAKPSNLVHIFDPTILEVCDSKRETLRHPKVCSWYLKCVKAGKPPVRMRCSKGKRFSSKLSYCESSRKVKCDDRYSA